MVIPDFQRRSVDLSDVCSLRRTGCSHDFKLNMVALVECALAFRNDCSAMKKDVRSVVAPNK